MAATVGGASVSGPQSPLNRNLERLFEDAHFTGELRISSRRLREFPKVASKYNLNDTVFCDLSKNRLSELPPEVTRLTALEKLNLYHNVIRFVPDTVMYLQCLTYLDISRNQLSVLPAQLCKLPLQVLLVGHNRLVSLPEEINQLTELIELDASCNQLSHLPIQLGDLQHLEALNLRKNFLVELPRELMFLKLVTLDISLNRISVLPVELRFMVSLVNLCVEHNPLTTPPAHLCTRGRIHIFKYLEIEAIREDRKRGILEGVDGKRLPRKPSTLPDARLPANDPRRKRYTVDSTNGFSGSSNGTAAIPTSDASNQPRWAQPIVHNNHTNGHSVDPAFESAPNIQQLKMDDDDVEDEQGNEERRRAARKILEQHMATQEEQRLPSHAQTYREYKESLRQQRANVYKARDSGHTPSPDAPLVSVVQQQQQQQQPPPPPLPPHHHHHHQEAPRPFMSHQVRFKAAQPVPREVGGELNRPLSLNLGADNVKAAQKEAVLSYVKAKTSPPYRAPEVLTAAVAYRSAAPCTLASPDTPSPPYRSPPIAPATKAVRPSFPPPPPANGSQTPPPVHTAASASFTVRREMERQREEMEQIQQLRQCIESRLKVSLPDDLSSALQDGVVLCHLANHVRPRSVASIHVPSPAVPKLTVAKCRRNVENFIEACRRIGVPESLLCTCDDVTTSLDPCKVLETVRCFLDPPTKCDSPAPPTSVPLTPPPTPAKRDASPAIDVNENSENLVSAPVKRVTFAIDSDDPAREVPSSQLSQVLQVPSLVADDDTGGSIAEEDSPVDGEVSRKVDARVTMRELIVSHCAFFLVLLMAAAVNYLSC